MEHTQKDFDHEDLNRPGLVVLDIRRDSPLVVTLGGKIVIDARDKPTPTRPRGWTDRNELAKYNTLINAIRTAFASGDGPEGMRKVLLEEVQKLGLDAKEALILGEVPEHWKPTTEIARNFVRKK